MGLKSTQKIKDKTLHAGDNKLFSDDEWVSPSELFGEIKVLNHPLMHEAFDRILDQHVIKQPTAFLSLCSATRPYNYSTKWKEYIKHFDNKVDFIVVSNGGMIPEEFWLSYPYLNYDAGDHEDDVLYKKVQYDRMTRFFKRHLYDYVIANFSPSQRNAEPAEKSLSELKDAGYIKDYILIPDEATYKEAQSKVIRFTLSDKQSQGWIAGDMFPDLHPVIFGRLKEQVELWSSSKVITFDV